VLTSAGEWQSQFGDLWTKKWNREARVITLWVKPGAIDSHPERTNRSGSHLSTVSQIYTVQPLAHARGIRMPGRTILLDSEIYAFLHDVPTQLYL